MKHLALASRAHAWLVPTVLVFASPVAATPFARPPARPASVAPPHTNAAAGPSRPGSLPNGTRTHAPASARPGATHPAPASSPPPPLTLQLSGVRVDAPLPWAAVMHAIRRDAWPRLVHCVTPPPALRGHATVILRVVQGTTEVRIEDGPLARNASLARCVREATAAIVLPPHEDELDAVTVTFDLAFNLPPLGATPTRARR